jgi:hypothetical protein
MPLVSIPCILCVNELCLAFLIYGGSLAAYRVGRIRHRADCLNHHQFNCEPQKMTTNTTLAQHPVAIIGLGGMFAKSRNVKAYWRTLLNGIDCITDPPATHHQLNDYFRYRSKESRTTFTAIAAVFFRRCPSIPPNSAFHRHPWRPRTPPSCWAWWPLKWP